MKLEVSYRKEDSVVAILIVIIIIQWLGVRMKGGTEAGQEGAALTNQRAETRPPD